MFSHLFVAEGAERNITIRKHGDRLLELSIVKLFSGAQDEGLKDSGFERCASASIWKKIYKSTHLQLSPFEKTVLYRESKAIFSFLSVWKSKGNLWFA